MRRSQLLRIFLLFLCFLIGFWLGNLKNCTQTREQLIQRNVLPSIVDDNHELRKIQTAQFNRVARLHSMKAHSCCEKKLYLQNLSPVQAKNVLHHVIVDRKNKILFCYVPKVASSNTKRLILTLQGRSENSDAIKYFDQKGFEFLADNNSTDIEYMLKTFYKFMFVRHPFDRLVSGYRNKFLEPNVRFRHTWGRSIVSRFRRSNMPTGDIDVPTFREFVHYLISIKPEQMNEHWMSVYELCQPCMISYDFVGSFEDLDLDIDAFLKAINAPENVKFPRKQAFYKQRLNASTVAKYYEGLTAHEYRTLYQKYLKDFKCFTYPFRNVKRHPRDSQIN